MKNWKKANYLFSHTLGKNFNTVNCISEKNILNNLNEKKLKYFVPPIRVLFIFCTVYKKVKEKCLRIIPVAN